PLCAESCAAGARLTGDNNFAAPVTNVACNAGSYSLLFRYCGGAAVEAELRVGVGHQCRLYRPEFCHALRDFFVACARLASREVEVLFEVAGLRSQQALVERCEVLRQVRDQGGETFAGT